MRGVTLEDAPDPAGGHKDPLLAEVIAGPNRAVGRELQGERENSILHVGFDPVLGVGPATALVEQGLRAPLVSSGLVAVERVSETLPSCGRPSRRSAAPPQG